MQILPQAHVSTTTNPPRVFAVVRPDRSTSYSSLARYGLCYRRSNVVCRLTATTVSHAKAAEQIVMLFGMCTDAGEPTNRVLDGGPVQIPAGEDEILTAAKRNRPRICRHMSNGLYTQSDAPGSAHELRAKMYSHGLG